MPKVVSVRIQQLQTSYRPESCGFTFTRCEDCYLYFLVLAVREHNSQKCQNTGFEGGGQQKSPSLTDVIFGFIACPQGENPFTVTGNLDNNK